VCSLARRPRQAGQQLAHQWEPEWEQPALQGGNGAECGHGKSWIESNSNSNSNGGGESERAAGNGQRASWPKEEPVRSEASSGLQWRLDANAARPPGCSS